MVTATGDGSFTVVPIEQKATGIQSLRVKVDSTRFFYVEFQQPFGFDNFAATAPASMACSSTGGPTTPRGNFRHGGGASPCTPGQYDDHDDLVFALR